MSRLRQFRATNLQSLLRNYNLFVDYLSRQILIPASGLTTSEIRPGSLDRRVLTGDLVLRPDGRKLLFPIDDADVRVQYIGSGWTVVADSGSLSGSHHLTHTVGDKVRLEFIGDWIGFFTSKQPDLGHIEIFLDGNSQGTFDCFEQRLWHLHEIWNSGQLEFGHHVVEVVVLNSKNPASSDFGVRVEGFTTGQHFSIIPVGFEEFMWEAQFTTDAGGFAVVTHPLPSGYGIFDVHGSLLMDETGVFSVNRAHVRNWTLFFTQFDELDPNTTYTYVVRQWIVRNRE